ncbi:MAG: DUF1778 domain-containing protein [Desulfobacula sp.]|uniref:type II toxin-antitoxin system TacA family antitoxin n=1 Tax=Desulfobacula sp. TaxID=2593537 RepID=UPI0025C3B344|nr:DUF1778 domain-containing protein [Desulfobacula sp.]MCD4719919.1 DUF1778 domain-containing protein [Desulfobacula sp.]
MPGVEKRFQTRMPYHVHKKLIQAAELSGATLNQFVVQSALEKAKSVIEYDRVLNLTYNDALTLFEAVENPPKPNDKLIQAARAYKQEFGNESV